MPLSVAAPRLVRRERSGLELTVHDAPSRFVALEAAAAARLLRPDAAAERTAATYWASWTEPELRPPGPLALPAAVWAQLRQHDRVYYRAHSSSHARSWQDYATTLPGDAVEGAPSVRLCDGWVLAGDAGSEEEVAAALGAASSHPQFDAIDGGIGLSALLCVHRFSPRRPSASSQLEWVAVLQSATPPLRRTLVQRLEFTSKELIAAHMIEDRIDQPTAAQPDLDLAVALDTQAHRWLKRTLGPFTVFQDNAPLPGEEGGTCVTLSSSRCVYFAWTTWFGEPEVIVPR